MSESPDPNETHHTPDATRVPNRAKDYDIAFDEMCRLLILLVELPDNMEKATAVEALQIAQQKLQEYHRHQHNSQDETERVVTKSAHTSKTHQEFENEIGSQGLSLDGDISPETDIKRYNGQTFNKVPITELSDNMEHATAVKALQIAQQKVQDGPRHQYTSKALELPETSAQDLKGWISCNIQTAEELLADSR